MSYLHGNENKPKFSSSQTGKFICISLLDGIPITRFQLKLVFSTNSRDIGVMHENGTVSIVGRSKDMIVRGGENIYPTEVENYIDKHPKVADVQVWLIKCRFKKNNSNREDIDNEEKSRFVLNVT